MNVFGVRNIICYLQLTKEIAELQSEIVNSPEEYQSRLDELEQQKNQKIEDRNMKQEAINDKKQFIKQMEEKTNFIESMNSELALLGDAYKQIKYSFIYTCVNCLKIL